MAEKMLLYGRREEIENMLFSALPALPPFSLETDNLITSLSFEDISEKDLFDVYDLVEDILISDRGATLEETLVAFLAANNLKMATAESCTGGMVASSIINVPGASKVFYEGIVSYSDLSKRKRLFVREETLSEYGAVSGETAEEMALGLINENVDLGISTTGIAGPEGGTSEKPVGLVYIGVCYGNFEPISHKFVFRGNRSEIRIQAKNTALFLALQYLKNQL